LSHQHPAVVTAVKNAATSVLVPLTSLGEQGEGKSKAFIF